MIRDIRKMRKNNTITLSMTSKQIATGSSKDLKKARSSEQINLRGFMDNKNQKIKNIDQKLELHQSEIQKNNSIIEQLTEHLMSVKDQLTIERQKIETEEKKNRMLKDEIERTNKILRSKNSRIDELTKKYDNSEKQNETLRHLPHRVEELSKVNTQLRKQVSSLQDQVTQRKLQAAQKETQMSRLREKLRDLGCTKAEYEKLKNIVNEKQKQISHLNSQILMINNEKNLQSHTSQQQIKKLGQRHKEVSQTIRCLEKQMKSKSSTIDLLTNKVNKLQIDLNSAKKNLRDKQIASLNHTTQLSQLEKKVSQLNGMLKNKENTDSKKLQQITNKYKQSLQSELNNKEILKSENEKLSVLCGKFESMKKQSRTLESLYNSMVPQIQCPFGHELKNPVTIIPCGHNYCLNCKKGYSKECSQCNGKLKIEAVYRNELMDDIINIVDGIRKILDIVK